MPVTTSIFLTGTDGHRPLALYTVLIAVTGYQLIWYQQAWRAASHNVTSWHSKQVRGQKWTWVAELVFVYIAHGSTENKNCFRTLVLHSCVVFYCYILHHLAPPCIARKNLDEPNAKRWVAPRYGYRDVFWHGQILRYTAAHSMPPGIPMKMQNLQSKMWPSFSLCFTYLHGCRQAFPVKIHTKYWVEFDTLRYPSLIPILTLELNIPQHARRIFDDIGSAAYRGICSTVSSANCMGFRPLWACKLPFRSWGFLQFANELDDFQS